MANVYEITNEQIPQLLLVVSDDLKIPIDVFSTELDEQTILDYDAALTSKLVSYCESIISNNYTLSTINVMSSVAKVRKTFRDLYKSYLS